MLISVEKSELSHYKEKKKVCGLNKTPQKWTLIKVTDLLQQFTTTQKNLSKLEQSIENMVIIQNAWDVLIEAEPLEWFLFSFPF